MSTVIREKAGQEAKEAAQKAREGWRQADQKEADQKEPDQKEPAKKK